MFGSYRFLFGLGAALCLCMALVSAADVNAESDTRMDFHKWRVAHNKLYQSEQDHEDRFQIWQANSELIAQHNAESKHTFTLAMNKFGDMTAEEFGKMSGDADFDASTTDAHVHNTLTHKQMQELERHRANSLATLPCFIPPARDWRLHGATTPVIDQGMCASAYATTATAVSESINARLRNLTAAAPLSVQHSMDCSSYNLLNLFCNGGTVEKALEASRALGGLVTAAVLPYLAKAGTSCRYGVGNTASPKFGAPTASSVAIAAGDVHEMIRQTVQGVMVVAYVRNTDSQWQFYSSGIFNSASCLPGKNTAVAIVGYNIADNYWIAKNSVGSLWGESGYIRIQMGANLCGIEQSAVRATHSSFTDVPAWDSSSTVASSACATLAKKQSPYWFPTNVV